MAQLNVSLHVALVISLIYGTLGYWGHSFPWDVPKINLAMRIIRRQNVISVLYNTFLYVSSPKTTLSLRITKHFCHTNELNTVLYGLPLLNPLRWLIFSAEGKVHTANRSGELYLYYYPLHKHYINIKECSELSLTVTRKHHSAFMLRVFQLLLEF